MSKESVCPVIESSKTSNSLVTPIDVTEFNGISFRTIAPQLQTLQQWVLWRQIDRDGKSKKCRSVLSPVTGQVRQVLRRSMMHNYSSTTDPVLCD